MRKSAAGKFIILQFTVFGIVEINEKGDVWRIVWGLENGAGPTSEFLSHFLNHSMRKEVTDSTNRVICHCHATNVIALTFILPLTDKVFTSVLWRAATECTVVSPEGIGVVKWMVPGGPEIAKVTSELMKKYQAVIWAHHGLFVSGPDNNTAFGLAHTTGQLVLQTITDDDLRAIARNFQITLNEDLLD